MAIIAPFSNLTIITTNSIPKERERGDALIVRMMIIWRRQQEEPLSYLPNLPPPGFVRTVSLHRGRPEVRRGLCLPSLCQFCARRSAINDVQTEG